MLDIQINNDKIKVILRVSFFNSFWNTILKEVKNLSCHYFEHQLIANYNQEGYAISSFNSHPEWQQEYWRDYWDSDLATHKICQIAETDEFAISSWDFIDSQSNVMKRRKTVCDLFDGVQFAFKNEDGVLETCSFGWKEDGRGQMGFERLLNLFNAVSDFRDAHFKLFSGSIQHFSDGKQ